MITPTAYVTLAAIYALRNVSGALPTNRVEFAQVVEDRYKWKIDEQTIDKIVRQLNGWGFIEIIEDKYAGEMLKLFGARSDEALSELHNLGLGQLVSNARSGGVQWFVKIFNNKDFWNDLYHDPLIEPTLTAADTNLESLDAIPASDRVVTRGDNKAAVELIEADVRSLVEELESSNEIGAELGEERDVITGELKTAETLLSQPAFRVSRLYALVLPVLRFLADKFAAGAIGEMAKRLITALFGLG
jgi:hypothetical protein